MRRDTLWMVWILVLLAAAPLGAQTASKVSHAKPADSFLTGAPLTLEQVIRIIGQDAIPLRRRKEAIQNRGVDFSMSEEVAAELKGAGAPDELLDLIRAKAKPLPPPPPPKPAPAGSISVSCAPLECEVALNDGPSQSTANGVLELRGISPGKYTVDFRKSGYVSREREISVQAFETVTASEKLEPTRETQEAWGAALFKKMLEALGGQDGLKDLGSLQAAGSATLVGSDGRDVRWTLRMRTRGDRALFQVRSGAVAHEVLFTGSEFTASRSLRGQDARELPAALGWIRDNQIGALLSRLDKQQYKILKAAGDAPDSEAALIAEGGTDKVSIALDTDARPQRVHISTETGIGALLITYSGYTQIGRAWYPTRVQVKPDGQQRGIDLHFDLVEQDTRSKDSDFRLRGGLFSNLYN